MVYMMCIKWYERSVMKVRREAKEVVKLCAQLVESNIFERV